MHHRRVPGYRHARLTRCAQDGAAFHTPAEQRDAATSQAVRALQAAETQREQSQMTQNMCR